MLRNDNSLISLSTILTEKGLDTKHENKT